MAADPRWLEILKASGGQALAVAAACAVLLALGKNGWIAPLDPLVEQGAVFGLVLGLILAIVSFWSALYERFPIDKLIAERLREKHAKKLIEDYIPHLTEDESNILG